MKQNENITLYSNGCPKCNVLKAKLSAKNIAFTESDNLQLLAEKGFQSLPVLKIDEDKYLNFFDANNWVNNAQ